MGHIYELTVSRIVWRNALEIFRNHFLYFRVERLAGETIHCSLSGSSP